MKIAAVNYVHGGTALELVAETDVEYMVLAEIWKHGQMKTGDGNSIAPNGGSTGFYLKTAPKEGK